MVVNDFGGRTLWITVYASLPGQDPSGKSHQCGSSAKFFDGSAIASRPVSWTSGGLDVKELAGCTKWISLVTPLRAADGLQSISRCKGIAEDAAKQVALLGILRLGLDGKLSMLLGYGTDGMNTVDGSGICTVDGYEQSAIEHSGDGRVVNAGAERHSVRVQA
jgi:hypothetical protein